MVATAPIAARRGGRGTKPRAGAARPAFTFLEAVAASALLGIIAAALFAVCNLLHASQVRQQQTLGAAELANRLILQFLDDEDALPSQSLAIEYGPYRYRWTLSNEPIELAEQNAAQRLANQSSPIDINRFRQITARVWLSEESGGDRSPGRGQPEVAITRLMDPIGIRNYDAVERMLETPEGRERFMRQMMGFNPPQSGAGGASGNGRGGRNNTSPPGREW